MRKKSKRTKGIEKAHPFDGLSRVNPHAAGVDIGAEEIVVCVAANETTQLVRGFGNYTVDLHAIADWLKEQKIKTVAMESTGVYWIPLFEVLEQKGFDCLLISSRSLRRVPGRKSDVTDAQWIQTLHNYGMLESSFRPQGDLIALRSLLRHRRNLVDHRSPHVLHMQKALLQMNIQLSQAVSDVTGVTGQAIIRTIVAGVRDPKLLASLREPGCKKSEEEIAKALTGTWREEHLFVLKQALALFDFYSQQILECDQEIERMYAKTRADLAVEELQPLPKRKRNSHSKNQFHETEKIRGHLKRISGVDISLVDGMGVSLAQTVIMECGTDTPALHPQRGASVSKFPTEKHFCAWLGLAPKHEISGNKILKNSTLKTKSRAGQAFRTLAPHCVWCSAGVAAQSVKQAECAFGVLYRRLRARLGPSQATVATAHAIARVVYRMLTLAPHCVWCSAGEYRVEYDPLTVNEYQKQYEPSAAGQVYEEAGGQNGLRTAAGRSLNMTGANKSGVLRVENALFWIKHLAEKGRFCVDSWLCPVSSPFFQPGRRS
jgi:transposase